MTNEVPMISQDQITVLAVSINKIINEVKAGNKPETLFYADEIADILKKAEMETDDQKRRYYFSQLAVAVFTIEETGEYDEAVGEALDIIDVILG